MRAGLTQATLQRALGINAGIDITTFNALADSTNYPSGEGTAVLKVRAATEPYLTGQGCCLDALADSISYSVVEGAGVLKVCVATGP